MREPPRWPLRASEPHIALGTVFASAQAGVTAVQLFARTVQRRRVRLQHPSLLTGAANVRTVSSTRNNINSSTRTPRPTATSQHGSVNDATLAGATLRNQAAHVSSSHQPLLITIGCENGPLGCPWVVSLERVESSSSSSSLSSVSQYRVSFLDLNHDLRHCTERQSHSPDGMDDSDAELRLHQLFASPAPISENVSTSIRSGHGSHGLELGAGIGGLPDTFFHQNQQQQQVGVLGEAPGFRYFPSLSAIPTPTAATNSADSAGFDGFELEKYAINHVASTFAPSPMAAGPPSGAMLFDTGITGGFATQYIYQQYHQSQQPHQQHTWDVAGGFQANLQHHQPQHHREHLGSGHSTPLGSEAARVGTFDTSGRRHRDRYEPAIALSSDASPQPRTPTSYASPSSSSLLSPGSSSALAEKQSVKLNTKMRWISAKEASKAVNDYALFVQKKRARMDKKTSGGRNKKYICSCTHCAWFVRLIKVAKSDNWKISSMQLAHSEDCTGEAQPSARQLAELNTLRNCVLSASNDTPGKLEITHEDESSGRNLSTGRSSGGVGNERRLLVQTDFTAEGESLGVKIPVRLAYRAKKILQENSSNTSFSVEAIVRGVLGLPGRDLQEKIAESYKLLPSLLQKFSDLNPGSVVCLRKDERGRFKCSFVQPAPLAELLPTLQSAFGLEIVPCGRQLSSNNSEPPRYNGQFIVLLGKDGNLEHRVIAFGLIPIPDAENVAWFLRSLHNAGFQMGDAPVFLAYYQLGALAALRREFPRVLPMFCVESFIQTIEQQLMGTVSPLNLEFVTSQIRLASLAETLEAFRAHMDVVEQYFPSVASFLLSFDASLWTLHASRAVKKYHWNSTGLREYMRAEVQIVVKTKRPTNHQQQRQTGLGSSSRGHEQQQAYAEASSGFDVQHVSSIQLADFGMLVPLEISYQFLLHYLHVEARRAVEIATVASATPDSTAQHSPLGVQLTPGAEKLFRQELIEAERVEVCVSEDPAVAFVYASNANGDECRVHVDDGRCSCAAMYQLGIPCRHLIATARAFKGEKTILTECDKIYTLAMYQQGVQRQSSLEDRMPALGGLNRDSSIYPAPIYGSAGEADGAGAPVRSSGGSGKRRARDVWGGASRSAAVTATAKRTHLPSGSAFGTSEENAGTAGGNSSRTDSGRANQQQQSSADLVFDNCVV
ncbi:hypothetical protein Gpo141_00002364 [Globisporangium polare]